MSTWGILDAVLVGAVVAVAAVAVLIRSRGAATSAFLVFGILLALLWARLQAPDVAMAEAALGGGVAGALLADALERSRPPEPTRSLPRIPLALAIAAGAASAAALVTVVRALPLDPAELGPLARDRVADSGVSHPITAVLLNFRSLDTLLEIAVVVIAAVGAGAVARERLKPERGTDPVRGALAGILIPILLLLAGWILVAGSSQPGGAFQAGAVLAAALIIGHLCGIPFTTPRGRGGAALAGAGVLCFVALGAIGSASGGVWLQLDPAWAGAAILAVEAILTVGIAVALTMIFLAAGSRDVSSKDDASREVTR
ncbi:hydrogenase subunit MbhD domain-containing protein [Microbacterium aurantiacum]|uniref:hydrogenase subunit MbhD domain-containing protein n=1 Tax=Microbacterium aurantiacum TaxID=162393 RepID=UPI00342DB1EC